MQMQVGRGLKSVAKAAFDVKVMHLANPVLKTATYVIVGDKVNGVPVSILTDAIVSRGHKFTLSADRLYVARR